MLKILQVTLIGNTGSGKSTLQHKIMRYQSTFDSGWQTRYHLSSSAAMQYEGYYGENFCLETIDVQGLEHYAHWSEVPVDGSHIVIYCLDMTDPKQSFANIDIDALSRIASDAVIIVVPTKFDLAIQRKIGADLSLAEDTAAFMLVNEFEKCVEKNVKSDPVLQQLISKDRLQFHKPISSIANIEIENFCQTITAIGQKHCGKKLKFQLNDTNNETVNTLLFGEKNSGKSSLLARKRYDNSNGLSSGGYMRAQGWIGYFPFENGNITLAMVKTKWELNRIEASIFVGCIDMTSDKPLDYFQRVLEPDLAEILNGRNNIMILVPTKKDNVCEFKARLFNDKLIEYIQLNGNLQHLQQQGRLQIHPPVSVLDRTSVATLFNTLYSVVRTQLELKEDKKWIEALHRKPYIKNQNLFSPAIKKEILLASALISAAVALYVLVPNLDLSHMLLLMVAVLALTKGELIKRQAAEGYNRISEFFSSPRHPEVTVVKAPHYRQAVFIENPEHHHHLRP